MTLRFTEAEAVARAALGKAGQIQLAVSVAVCDGNGRLLVFFKLDGTDIMSGHEAIGRAIAAVNSRGPSEQATGKRGPASTVAAEGPGASTRPGGLPLTRSEDVIGAVGVCGGSDEQAVTCARAGVGALR